MKYFMISLSVAVSVIINVIPSFFNNGIGSVLRTLHLNQLSTDTLKIITALIVLAVYAYELMRKYSKRRLFAIFVALCVYPLLLCFMRMPEGNPLNYIPYWLTCLIDDGAYVAPVTAVFDWVVAVVLSVWVARGCMRIHRD